MIRQSSNLFYIQTNHTDYAFQVLDTGHLEHLYYGPSLGDLTMEDAAALAQKRVFEIGNTICYDADHRQLMPEDICLELSGRGKGDLRDPLVEAVFPDGSKTVDFLYEDARIEDYSGQERAGTDLLLPRAYDETGRAKRLTIVLREACRPLRLELYYDVFPDCDVICRSAALFNEGEEAVMIDRLLSNQLDLPDDGYVLGGFFGAWAREMNRVDLPVSAGRQVISSVAGASSNRANPFVMLSRPETGEQAGLCYGFHLIYSGNHYEAAEVNAYGKTRFVAGINPEGFSWRLGPGDSFLAPQSAMTVSDQGFTGMSHHMHAFIREHIVRGTWKHKPRPVLLNSWEAAYFDFNEKKLLKLAGKAREAGIELFVMDDGWFGKRNDDTTSLGDWRENREKLPGGLAGICRKVNDLGLDFGIWVEPEMVNEDSDLYRSHPDWVMQVPDRPHSEGRSQRILDLANPRVVDYMIEEMTRVFSSAGIAYVKWDMNRIFSDVYSPYVEKMARGEVDPPGMAAREEADSLGMAAQGETAHRYICGLYRMLDVLMKRFPDILFEGCASGGNRFDPGMLCYFPQIWASDNTDPICRARIQEGYSYGYPMSVVTAHVSASPNHQTLRITPLDTRYAVAFFGLLGYECNLCDLKQKEFEEVRAQIALYKEWRQLVQFGSFYRGSQPAGTHNRSGLRSWTCVSEDRTRAVGMILQELVTPNTQDACYKAAGLDADRRYHFGNRKIDQNLLQFGDLVNTQAPIHVRQDSLLHHAIARIRPMPGEQEDHTVSGALLMRAGVRLLPAFSGSGYSDQVRYFQDFSARLYFMEEDLPV